MSRKLPAIPEPSTNAENLRQTALAIKEVCEVLTGRRGGSRFDRAVTFQDLIDLGLIAEDEVPR